MSYAFNDWLNKPYEPGFESNIDSFVLKPGLDDSVIHFISEQKNEPPFLLDWRLKAFHHWQTLQPPTWANVDYAAINYQAMSYFAKPNAEHPKSLEDVDPDILDMYRKLGIPLHEQQKLSGVAVDAILDSVSVATTFQKTLKEAGVIFCPISEAIQNYPDIIKQYLGSVVPSTDNFFAALNMAVFSDGSFVYIPKGVRCPMELSTYFRINAANTGQFERTLIVVEDDGYVSYLEGCTAPQRSTHQLHAAVVELIAMNRSTIQYATVQNWYPGDANGVGGVYNFVTKRGECRGQHAAISWTQVETGSAITWKYPSVILRGDHSSGSFYSIALTKHHQQADTGTKMIHLGKDTTSTVHAKSISAGYSRNTYRGLVRMGSRSERAKNHTQCDAMLIGSHCSTFTIPTLDVHHATADVAHEASTTRINEQQLLYLQQRGLSIESSVSLLVNGFCRTVLAVLPMEFAVEAQKLLGIVLEGTIG
jgi:Fe-S cluster assembly protein SufB